jgi:predicted 2-oxoglutarate/Fe(II)-dependent dioxygenase YbiX
MGDPIPWFAARGSDGEVRFDLAAGRYVVLSLLGSTALPASRAFLDGVLARRRVIDPSRALFFALSIDPTDERAGRVATDGEAIGALWDFDRAVSMRLGALAENAGDAIAAYRPYTVLAGPDLRVLRVFGFDEPERQAAALLDALAGLPDLADGARAERHAPILILPNVFEREFCRVLIEHHRGSAARDSGFMVERDGRTHREVDHAIKSRNDVEIFDDTLRRHCRARLARRLIPEVKKVFQFAATHVERHMIGCYEASARGFFRAHRDDMTQGTAHRRFALTINLNAEDHDGGDLRFPEFGRRTYRAPTGGAVVFSCSLLHEATLVTKGRRYAYIPFLYDDAAASLRDANFRFVASHVGMKQAAEAEMAE